MNALEAELLTHEETNALWNGNARVDGNTI